LSESLTQPITDWAAGECGSGAAWQQSLTRKS
jgi:hypothetical protein